MPKKDLNDFQTLLADLWRELSPIVRGFLFLGFVLGGIAGARFLLAMQDSGWDDASVRLAARWIYLAVIGLFILGGFVGLIVGVLVELAIDRLRGKVPRSKKDRRSRRQK